MGDRALLSTVSFIMTIPALDQYLAIGMSFCLVIPGGNEKINADDRLRDGLGPSGCCFSQVSYIRT